MQFMHAHRLKIRIGQVVVLRFGMMGLVCSYNVLCNRDHCVEFESCPGPVVTIQHIDIAESLPPLETTSYDSLTSHDPEPSI